MVTWLNMKFCPLLGVSFHPKESSEKSKNIEVCLNLSLKKQCSDPFLP